jgi:hypothetical protein
MMRLIGLVFTFFLSATAVAQENSPYSRYGLGDVSPNQNIVTRSMGGISAAYSDYQSVNFINPSAYGNLSFIRDPKLARTSLRNTIFDIGAEVDTRTLKSTTPLNKFTSTNLIISYLQLGIPIKMKKANRKGIFLGAGFGLKPVSKINYKIYKTERVSGVDSLATLYEGSGGLNEVNVGFGLRYKQFNIGFNTGYRFGNRDFSTKLLLINDTVNYYRSNSANKSTFGGTFLTIGTQYEIYMKSTAIIRLGAYGSLSKKLKATQTETRETFTTDGSGNPFRIDSVYEKKSTGTVNYPASIGFGITYSDSANHWLVGVDIEKTFWSKYEFIGQKDKVQDNWKVRLGGEFFPAKVNTPIKKYFNFVRYRAGFYYGNDYINVGSTLPEYGFTFGAGFPLKLRKTFYETQASYLNTAIEIGSRGNRSNNIRESMVRISVGFSLSDLWFNRSKYY